MSTILEALKKSEQERKLNNLPTLSDMPPPVERPSLFKLVSIVIAIAILLAIAVLAVVYFIFDEPQTARSVTNETINIQGIDSQNTKVEQQGIVVSVISYSDQADKRFAIINGNMVRENEFVQAGIKVEQIQPDSVTLNQRGQTFTLQP